MNFQKNKNQEFATSESSAGEKSEKINMHYTYIYSIYILVYHRWSEITFSIPKNSMNYYKLKYDILKEVTYQLIPEQQDRETEFIDRLGRLKTLMSQMVIHDGDGNPSQFRTGKIEDCEREMDNFRLEIMKLLKKLGWLKFITTDPRVAIQELE